MAVVSLAWCLISVSTDQVEKGSQPCKPFQTTRQELIKASAAFEAAPNEKWIHGQWETNSNLCHSFKEHL